MKKRLLMVGATLVLVASFSGCWRQIPRELEANAQQTQERQAPVAKDSEAKTS